MANYFLSETAQFKPFTYQEMLAPVVAHQEELNKADETLNTLYEDAATKAFNFAAQDTAEKAIYDDLMKKLEGASAALNNGDATALKTIKDINKEYRRIMVPIGLQINKRAELAKQQAEEKKANPYIVYDIDYAEADLSKIHPGSTYTGLDLNKIMKDTSTEFTGVTSKIVRDDFKPAKIGDTDHYLLTTGTGYTEDEFNRAFNVDGKGTPDKTSPIYQFYEQKKGAIEARKDLSDKQKEAAEKAIKDAMRMSAGKFSTQLLQDPYYKHTKGKGTTADILKNQEIFVDYHATPEGQDKPEKAVVLMNGTYYNVEINGWQNVTTEQYNKYKKENNPIIHQIRTVQNSDGTISHYEVPVLGKRSKVTAEEQGYTTIEQEYKYNHATKQWEWMDSKRTTKTPGNYVGNKDGDGGSNDPADNALKIVKP